MANDFQDAVTCEGKDEAKRIVRMFLGIVKTSTEVEGDVRLELWNVGHGAEDAVFSTEWDITEPSEDVVDELVDAAEEDAMNVGRGTVRFKVIVPDIKKLGRAAFTLRIPNNSDIDSDDIEDIEELATRKGLMTQLMRHQEKVMKVGLGGAGKAMDVLQRQLDSALKRNTELESRHLETVQAYEELLSGKHVRDLELRKISNDERRKEQVAGVLMQGFPLLLNKFLSAKPSPAAAAALPPTDKPFTEESSALEVLLEGFMTTIEPEQLKKLMESGIFRGDQLMAFVEIAQTLQARIQAREQARNGQTQTNGASQPQPQPQPQPPQPYTPAT